MKKLLLFAAICTNTHSYSLHTEQKSRKEDSSSSTAITSSTSSALSSTASISSASVSQPKSDWTLEETMRGLECYHRNKLAPSNEFALLIPNLPLMLEKPVNTVRFDNSELSRYSYSPKVNLLFTQDNNKLARMFNMDGKMISNFHLDGTVTYISSINEILSFNEKSGFATLYNIHGKIIALFQKSDLKIKNLHYDESLNKFISINDNGSITLWSRDGIATDIALYQGKTPIQFAKADYIPELRQLLTTSSDAVRTVTDKSERMRKIPCSEACKSALYIAPLNSIAIEYDKKIVLFDADNKQRISFKKPVYNDTNDYGYVVNGNLFWMVGSMQLFAESIDTNFQKKSIYTPYTSGTIKSAQYIRQENIFLVRHYSDTDDSGSGFEFGHAQRISPRTNHDILKYNASKNSLDRITLAEYRNYQEVNYLSDLGLFVAFSFYSPTNYSSTKDIYFFKYVEKEFQTKPLIKIYDTSTETFPREVFYDANTNRFIVLSSNNISFFENPIPKNFTEEQKYLLIFLHARKDEKIILNAQQKQTFASFSEQIQKHLMVYDIDWKKTAKTLSQWYDDNKSKQLIDTQSIEELTTIIDVSNDTKNLIKTLKELIQNYRKLDANKQAITTELIMEEISTILYVKDNPN